MSRPADLSIVTVNWKVADLVGELLGSIASNKEDLALEVYIVDNDSKDHIEDVVAKFRARSDVPVTLIRNDRNLGFAKANNQAIRRCSGRVVALLNPDTRVTKGALKRTLEWMAARPDVGIIGPKLLNHDGSLQESVRKFPGLIDQALILLKLQHVWPSAPPFRTYLAKDLDYGKEQDVDQLMGAALFVRRKVFESVGLLDERFFIWFEDVDFCKRAKAAGWGVVYLPTVQVIHHGGASFAQAMTLRKQRYFTSSMAKYFRKHRGAWSLAVLALPMLVGLLAASANSLWKSVRDKR
ncbi:MAG: glycosyltransferase family 2 protein [Patescibacteria group bacterium]